MGDVGVKADELSALLQERLGFRARDLHHALRKAGRRVPRRLRVEGEYIALAQHMELTPKLAKQIDSVRTKQIELEPSWAWCNARLATSSSSLLHVGLHCFHLFLLPLSNFLHLRLY